jgi:GMP synthase-like glutamine amidotransferase
VTASLSAGSLSGDSNPGHADNILARILDVERETEDEEDAYVSSHNDDYEDNADMHMDRDYYMPVGFSVGARSEDGGKGAMMNKRKKNSTQFAQLQLRDTGGDASV